MERETAKPIPMPFSFGHFPRQSVFAVCVSLLAQSELPLHEQLCSCRNMAVVADLHAEDVWETFALVFARCTAGVAGYICVRLNGNVRFLEGRMPVGILRGPTDAVAC